MRTRTQPPTVTVYDWINRYLDYAKQRFSQSTYKEKITAFKDLLEYVSRDSLADNSTSDVVLKLLSDIASSRSGYAAIKNRKNYCAGWSWGEKFLNLPASSPFKMVDRFSVDRSPSYVPSHEDVLKVFNNETGEVYTFLLFLLHTAARRGDVFRVQWSDIDMANEVITLGTRKRVGGGLEHDIIPMTPVLKKALQAHK